MKITITTDETTITVSNPNLGSKQISEVISIVTGIKSPVEVVEIPTQVTETKVVSAKEVKLEYDVDAMSKEAGLDLRACSSVHKMVTLAPSFVMGLKPRGFHSLVDWLVDEGWLSYRPEDQSLRSYYNKAQRSMR